MKRVNNSPFSMMLILVPLGDIHPALLSSPSCVDAIHLGWQCGAFYLGSTAPGQHDNLDLTWEAR